MTPAWLDRAEYPFASHWLEVEGAPPEERGPESAALVARFLEAHASRRTA